MTGYQKIVLALCLIFLGSTGSAEETNNAMSGAGEGSNSINQGVNIYVGEGNNGPIYINVRQSASIGNSNGASSGPNYVGADNGVLMPWPLWDEDTGILVKGQFYNPPTGPIIGLGVIHYCGTRLYLGIGNYGDREYDATDTTVTRDTGNNAATIEAGVMLPAMAKKNVGSNATSYKPGMRVIVVDAIPGMYSVFPTDAISAQINQDRKYWSGAIGTWLRDPATFEWYRDDNVTAEMVLELNNWYPRGGRGQTSWP